MKISINFNDDLDKAKFGYQMATNMVETLNQEILSRFNAMLTANSIIIAIYVLIFSEKNNMPDFIKILVPILGIVLCLLWFLFIHHGVYCQRQYRKEAKTIEKAYFKSFISLYCTDYSKDPCLIKCFSFKRTSIFVICIFLLLHLIMLLYLCHKFIFLYIY
jgi:hypothetical protein